MSCDVNYNKQGAKPNWCFVPNPVQMSQAQLLHNPPLPNPMVHLFHIYVSARTASLNPAGDVAMTSRLRVRASANRVVGLCFRNAVPQFIYVTSPQDSNSGKATGFRPPQQCRLP